MATYRAAGVDLSAADRLVDGIAGAVTATWGPGVVGGFGGFAAGLRVPPGFSDPVLMMSTDGVGTKAEVAKQAGMTDGLGADLVAMCVDDLAAVGARPLALSDYLAVGRLDPERERRLIASVAAACATAGIALLGGETAEHPGVVAADHFDLAGTALGIVEADGVIDGSAVRPGDAIVALGSPNLRSNGFSLVRSAVLPGIEPGDPFPGATRSIAEVLLEPSVIYAPVVASILATAPVTGLAHITGGGIAGNLGRILPSGCGAVVDTATWEPPAVFDFVAERGGISTAEMFAVFNMGIGFAVVVARDDAGAVIEAATANGQRAWVCGEAREGDDTVTIT